MTFLYILGATIEFFRNQLLTIAQDGALFGSDARYLIACVSGCLTNIVILLTFVDRLGCSHQSVQAGAIILVVGFPFVAFKYFVFPNTET